MKKTFLPFFALLCAVFLTACGTQMPKEEIPVSVDTSLMGVGVIYCTDGKYLIPVSTQTRLGENVPEQLVRSMQTISDESLGLTALIPENASVSVTQEGSIAKVSITGNPAEMDGDRIVCSIVNTLTQYGGIDAVSFSVNGISDKFGSTDISQPISESCLNPAYEIDDLKPFQVYFQNADGLVIPMTKATSTPSAEVYVKALMTVPKGAKDLTSLFPEDTRLNSAVLTEDGTLSLDFSSEFYGISALPDSEEQLLSSIDATCRQLDGVKRTAIYVDGIEYVSREHAVSVFNTLSSAETE